MYDPIRGVRMDIHLAVGRSCRGRLDWLSFCKCAGQSEWSSQREGTLMFCAHSSRHTLYPDLTRLVNHLSQGQRRDRFPSPPSFVRLSRPTPPSTSSVMCSNQGHLSFSTRINPTSCPSIPVLSCPGFLPFYSVIPFPLLSGRERAVSPSFSALIGHTSFTPGRLAQGKSKEWRQKKGWMAWCNGKMRVGRRSQCKLNQEMIVLQKVVKDGDVLTWKQTDFQ